MTMLDLDALDELDRSSTSGPWYFRNMDDDLCMCATAIAIRPNTSGDNDDLSDGRMHGIVAATLIQDRGYVDPEDGRSMENAELIAGVRTALPELLRLARIGAAADCA